MKKIMLLVCFLTLTVSMNAQQECAVICHNGTLVKAVGANAINGHLNHHSNDVLVSTDCDYVVVGDECESLSAPSYTYTTVLERGLEFTITDMLGKLRVEGYTGDNFKSLIPRREIVMINIQGYQSTKIYLK